MEIYFAIFTPIAVFMIIFGTYLSDKKRTKF